MATAAEVWAALADTIKYRAVEYAELYDYWTGNNELPIKMDEFKSRFGLFFARFRDNLTRPIINSAESRIRVTQFGDGENEGEEAWDLWIDNGLDVESRWVHIDAMVKSGSAVMVVDSDDEVRIYPQLIEQIAVLYDDYDPRKKQAAMKFWVEEDEKANQKVRVNLYFEDRIERYISRSARGALSNKFEDYELYEELTEDGLVPAIEDHGVGEVPIFEFHANFDMNTGKGRSDLADALPLIDSINKTLLDMLVASEYTAAPQRWATGVEIPLDPKTGEPMKTYKSGADRLWTAPSDQARFGQFPAGELSAYTSGIETIVDHLAFITRTPQYALYRMANFPSGESLKVVEMGLRSRVDDHQTEFGREWANVMIAAFRAMGQELTRSDIEPQFTPANHPFTTAEFLEELKVKAEVLGIPEEQLWHEAGYSRPEIEKMLDMREAEAVVGVDEFDIAAEATIGGVAEQPIPEEELGPGGLAPEL
jgi:hypothetical protein